MAAFSGNVSIPVSNRGRAALLGRGKKWMGPTPKPILSAHQPTLRRLSKSVSTGQTLPHNSPEGTLDAHEGRLQPRRRARGRPFEAENRAHFVAVAARATRQILVDYARNRDPIVSRHHSNSPHTGPRRSVKRQRQKQSSLFGTRPARSRPNRTGRRIASSRCSLQMFRGWQEITNSIFRGGLGG
jgi:hypothetical protein